MPVSPTAPTPLPLVRLRDEQFQPLPQLRQLSFQGSERSVALVQLAARAQAFERQGRRSRSPGRVRAVRVPIRWQKIAHRSLEGVGGPLERLTIARGDRGPHRIQKLRTVFQK